MKILSITAQKPHSTGSGTYMTELVRSFARMGMEQAVVCGIYPDDEVSFPDGVTCYPVFFTEKSDSIARADMPAAPCRQKPETFRQLPFPITGMSDIMPYESTRYRDLTPDMVSEFENAFMGAVSRAVDAIDPDLIICHHLFLLTALVRKHFPDRRVIGISHGTDLRQMHNCEYLRELVRPHIAKLDMALALHEKQAEQIKEIFGMDAERVRVIGSGYNDGLFNTDGRTERGPGQAVRICYAGKISRPKGVPEMLDALELLAADDSVPEFRLTLAGGCQDEALLGRMDGLPEYAEYLGQIPQASLADVLRRNDVFVLPSYFEGLPLVLIEAMASGAVPVSTDLPGVRAWIDANVSGANVRYVPMPAMKSIDEPTEEGRNAFKNDLADIIGDLVKDAAEGRAGSLPDTSSITWDGVAKKLLEFVSYSL